MAKYIFLQNYSATGQNVGTSGSGMPLVKVNKTFKKDEVYDGTVSGNNINISTTGGRKVMGGGTYVGATVYPIPVGGNIVKLESGTPVVDAGAPSTTNNVTTTSSIFTVKNGVIALVVVGGIVALIYGIKHFTK